MMKKFLATFLVLCTLLPLSAGATAQPQVTKRPNYEYYKNLPGITQEEIDAIELLKTEHSQFVIAQNHSTETFDQGDGTIGGFTSLFCDWLSRFFGIPFQPAILEWDELMEGITSHQVDFTGELTPTALRRKTLYMTDAIAERSIKYYRLAGSEKLTDIAKERPLIYGFLNGANTSQDVKQVATEEYTVLYMKDYSEAIRFLKAGRIDAFFEENIAEAAFDEYPEIVSADYFPLVYIPVALTTANPQLAPIITVMQKYLEEGGLYHLTELYNIGTQEYRQHKLFVQLTPEEKQYLQDHAEEPVLMAAEYDNYPVSFYNVTEEEWQGISQDVLKEVGALTGLTFKPLNEPGYPWALIFPLLEEGQVSLISELIPSPEREGLFLWPDTHYSEDHYALLSLAETENIKVNQILYSSIAVEADTAFEQIFDTWFPNHPNKLRCASVNDCFVALESGQVDFVMAGRNMMLSMTNYAERPGFKVNILFDNVYESTFGLNINETLLCSILSKALKLVDTSSISDHWSHRVFDYRAALTRSQMPYLIGVAVLLLVVLMMALVLLKRRQDSAKTLENLVRQRTAELEVQTLAAEEASQAKSEFLSRMSHEIRTPLNAVIGMAQVTQQMKDLPPKAVDANEKIITASHHLLEVLNAILDMAKIESGKFTLVIEPFALGLAMEEVAEMVAERCKEKGLLFETNLDSLPSLYLSGDKLRLKQVLINLLGNSIKFTNAGGIIRLQVQVRDQSDTEATLDFVVEDQGVGMTEEQLSRLFTPFDQTDDSVAIKYGGTGLGLAISQSMVGEMGGVIQAESQPEKGSRFSFTITLPKAEPPKATLHQERALDLHGRRILVAEDVEVNRLILIELLASTGVVIDEAVDGQDALDKWAVSPPYYYDLIFMDVQMPNLNGYETTRAIRALNRPDAKTVPIIAMTANAYKEDIERALESGMNAHIAKPVDFGLILQALEKYLG